MDQPRATASPSYRYLLTVVPVFVVCGRAGVARVLSCSLRGKIMRALGPPASDVEPLLPSPALRADPCRLGAYPFRRVG